MTRIEDIFAPYGGIYMDLPIYKIKKINLNLVKREVR